MKSQECTLIVNTANGYCLTPEKCSSISEAVRKGRESFGFAYRVFAGSKAIRSGYCER